jgi:caffeoyl-CoA O-methyltransferase
MAFVVHEDIERYAEEHTTSGTQLLAELWAETHETLAAPQMLTGPIEGRFLELLVYASGARRILELGTFSGYSSISMAAGLVAGGHIHTCEIDETHAAVARRYIERAGLSDRITVNMGPGLETIERLGGEWDLVFVDADKPNYLNYYEAVVPRLTERGIIVADNTLWSGKVLDDADRSEGTVAIRAFNDRVRSDDRVVCVQLTIRDGVTLIRRA